MNRFVIDPTLQCKHPNLGLSRPGDPMYTGEAYGQPPPLDWTQKPTCKIAYYPPYMGQPKKGTKCLPYSSPMGCLRGSCCPKDHEAQDLVQQMIKNSVQLDHIAATQERINDSLARLCYQQQRLATATLQLDVKLRAMNVLQGSKKAQAAPITGSAARKFESLVKITERGETLKPGAFPKKNRRG